MKKFIAVVLCMLMVLSVFAACKDEPKEQSETTGEPGQSGNQKDSIGLFNVDLKEYITVGEYKNIKISSENEAFVEIVKYERETDLKNAGYGEQVEITSGTVREGDTANITYVGTLNGVAFEGGTNTTGHDLVIGSGSFIDGFEDGLIGKKIGDTVELNLTFPENYGNEELNGKDVVFTVSIKKVTRTEYPEKVTNDMAKRMGYKDAEEFDASVFVRAVQTYCHETVAEKAKVIKTPEEDLEFFVDLEMANYEQIATAYGVTLETYFGTDVESVRAELREYYKGLLPYYMTLYYIAQQENLIPKATDIDAKLAELAAEQSTSSNQVTVEQLKESVDYKQVEYIIVYDKVRQFLFENADVE